MGKEYIAGESQRYRKDGESMADILLKLIYYDLDEEMRTENKPTTV